MTAQRFNFRSPVWQKHIQLIAKALVSWLEQWSVRSTTSGKSASLTLPNCLHVLLWLAASDLLAYQLRLNSQPCGDVYHSLAHPIAICEPHRHGQIHIPTSQASARDPATVLLAKNFSLRQAANKYGRLLHLRTYPYPYRRCASL